MEQNHVELKKEWDAAIQDMAGGGRACSLPPAVLVSRVEAEQRQNGQSAGNVSRKRSREPSPAPPRSAEAVRPGKGAGKARPILNNGDQVRNSMERQMRILTTQMNRIMGVKGKGGANPGKGNVDKGKGNVEKGKSYQRPPFFKGNSHRLDQNEPSHKGKDQQDQPSHKGWPHASSSWQGRDQNWSSGWDWQSDNRSQGSAETSSDWYG